MNATPYGKIEKIALDMAYDNGCINIHEPETTLVAALSQLIAQYTPAELGAYEMWLRGLSEDQFTIAYCGDVLEMEEVMSTAPDGMDGFIHRLWDEVQNREVHLRAEAEQAYKDDVHMNAHPKGFEG